MDREARISQYVVAGVPPPLRGLVATCHGYRLEGFRPGVHRGLPGRHLTLVLPLGEPLRLAFGAEPEPPERALASAAAGLHTAPALIGHDGRQVGVQLDLTPSGARRLLGLPLAELAARAVELDVLWGSLAGELADRLDGAASWDRRFATLHEVLARRLAAGSGAAARDVRPEVRRAWARIVASGGRVPISEVAAEVGWSRRHLASRFDAEVGLTPKALARVVRFERARAMLAGQGRDGRTASRSPADVAAACGYADQSHLTRDFRQFAGCSPTRWLADEDLVLPADA